MGFRKLLFMALAGPLFLASCSSDDSNNDVDDQPLGAYDNGMFVLNEGNSNQSSASVTFIANDGTVQQDVYNIVNQGKPGLGTYLQQLFFDEERAFIISGSANKITVVNRYTFEFIASIETDFSSPRYGAIANGKAYITNYADFNTGADDFLTVIDLTDYSTSKIQLNNWSEKIIEENGKLYIANGFYGEGTSITVFNPVTNTSEAVIELGVSPNSLEEEDGILYVLGGNRITTINLATNQIAGSIEIPSGLSDARNLTIDEDKLYFTNFTSVYAMAVNAVAVPATPVFEYNSDSAYGGMYGFAVSGNKIYVADGGDFASDSEVYSYSLNGSLLTTTSAGVGPNGFYFN